MVAWLSLFAMAVTFGPYFVVAAASDADDDRGGPGLRFLVLLSAAAVGQVLLLGMG